MQAETNVRSEISSLTQPSFESKISSLQSGKWLIDHLGAESIFEENINSGAADLVEHRVTSGTKSLFSIPKELLSPSLTRYLVEQEFEGVVLSVDKKSRTFYVRLVDETNPSAPDEEALMSFDEISSDDQDLIVPGALFSWVMGRTERNGTVSRHSEIRFRRVFRFSKQSIIQAENKAAEFYALLDEV